MTSERLHHLRGVLGRAGLDGFIVPRADEHLGEYVPASAERLAWLTGFTGSAGLAVVTMDAAVLFTDGRYMLQAAGQVGPDYQVLHITEQPPPGWLAGRASRIGYDPWLISEDALDRYTAAGLDMVPLTPNPLDALWPDRPAPPAAPVTLHPMALAGEDAAAKRAELGAALQAAGQDCCVLTDPASVNWLLNIRGGDVPFTPVALCFAIVQASGDATLFIDPAKLSAPVTEWLGAAVTTQPPAALPAALAALHGQRVRVDRSGAPVAVAQALRAAGATVADGTDPCLLPKACKNAVEQAGARAAHHRDALALCRFLHWLDTTRGATELSAAAQLVAFRQALPHFRGESFPAISGAGEHGAVIHYRVTPESDRAIQPNEVYLIDSGAQFSDGTTDVTRTVWTGPDQPPAELCERFTRVLQGHIALATACFPQGIAGLHLDALARRPLWQAGLDYDHGTGHGVGSYLSVHEGPASLSRAARPVPIAAGMILSNEPGFYAPGAYGIRLENLLLVQPAEFPAATRPFLRFEVLTWAPFDRRLIQPNLLTAPERTWLDTYHATVRQVLASTGDAALDAWLDHACAKLDG